MSETYDLAVIGTGPGGYVAALRAAQLGASVVAIEKKAVGGVCLNEGCIPSKAMLHSAELYALAKGAARYGVRIDNPKLDWKGVLGHRDAVVRQMTRGVALLLDRAGIRVIMGTARFLRQDTLRVATEDGKETVVAKNIIIATGSRNAAIPIPGLDGPRVVDHWGAMTLPELPKSLCIIGGGAIGIELGSLFQDCDVDVTIVEMLPRLAPLMDASIGEELARSLKRRGVDVRTGTRVMRIDHGEQGCTVTVQENDEPEQQIEAQLVLSAVGRVPNVEDIGLDVLGLRPDRKGIAVDTRMRTAVPHVYAIGDVAADGAMLAHVAMHQGVVAAEDALGHAAAMDYHAVPSCIFSEPEAATVGMSEEEAVAAGHDVSIGSFAFRPNGKAAAIGQKDGAAKIVADKATGAILGVHIVGPHASDLILEGTLAMSLEATLAEIEHTIHPHPTLGEVLHEAALDAMGRPLHVPFR
jgi:dihydrolipoamide dehydrogenase